MEEIEEIKVKSKPLSMMDKKLQEKFTDSIVNQSDLMDQIGKQLITLELAIPGIYATILKLIAGESATLKGGVFLFLTFGLWFVALLFGFLLYFLKSIESM